MPSALPTPMKPKPLVRTPQDKALVKIARALPVDVANLNEYPAAKIGRPSTYNEAIARRILDLMLQGYEVTRAMRHVGITWWSFYHWMYLMPHFKQAVSLAREGMAHLFAEQILDIADKADADLVTMQGKDGRMWQKYNNEVTRRSQIKIDTRRWLMEKYSPHVFGQRQQVEHSGEVTANVGVDVRFSLGSASSPEARRLANQFAEDMDAAVGDAGRNNTDADVIDVESEPVKQAQQLSDADLSTSPLDATE